MAETVEQTIRRVAAEEGVSPELLVAIATRESGLKADALGDYVDGRAQSGGPFQENDGGRGHGIPMAQRQDVEASTRRAAAEVKETIRRNPTADPGTIAVLAQRPEQSLRAGYAAEINQRYAQLSATRAGSAPAPAEVPEPPAGAPGTAGGAAAFQRLLDIAKSQLGKPYIWGSGSGAGGRGRQDIDPATNLPRGYDCSGFTSWAYEQAFGVKIPAYTGTAHEASQPLAPGEQPQPGDLVFWNMNQSDPRRQHTGIYIGDGKVIQSGGAGNGVNIDRADVVGPPEYRRVPAARQALVAGVRFGPNGDPSPAPLPPSTGIQSQEDRDQGGPARPTTAPGSTNVPDPPATPAAQTTLTRAQKNADDLEKKVAELEARQAAMPADERSILDAAIQAARGSLTTAIGTLRQAEADARTAATTTTAAPSTRPGPGGSTVQWNPTGGAAGKGAWEDSGIPVDPATQAAAGVTQRTAELALARAQQLYDAENDPVKKETARVALEQAKQNLATSQAAAERAARPTITTSTTNGRITGIDQQTGETKYTVDTMTPEERDWDRVKQEGARVAQDLANQNAQGLIDQRERDARWKRWYDENVTIPMAQATEARARAAEARAAEQERRAAATAAQQAEQARQQFGYTAGRDAVADELKLLPTRVGADFFAQKDANEARIAAGQPTQYSASAFTTPAPNLQEIARQATARALANISPYAATLAGVPQAQAPDYSKINVQQLLATAPPYAAGAAAPSVPGMPGATAPPVPLR